MLAWHPAAGWVWSEGDGTNIQQGAANLDYETVVIVRDETNVSMYLDRVLIGSTAHGGGPLGQYTQRVGSVSTTAGDPEALASQYQFMGELSVLAVYRSADIGVDELTDAIEAFDGVRYGAVAPLTNMDLIMQYDLGPFGPATADATQGNITTGEFSFDPGNYPGFSTWQLVAFISTTDASADYTVELYRTTPGDEEVVSSSTITGSNTTPSEQVATLTLGTGAGELKDDGAYTYTFRISNAGVDAGDITILDTVFLRGVV